MSACFWGMEIFNPWGWGDDGRVASKELKGFLVESGEVYSVWLLMSKLRRVV